MDVPLDSVTALRLVVASSVDLIAVDLIVVSLEVLCFGWLHYFFWSYTS